MAVMSKLSIRARNVDSNKSLPIIRSEDLPDVDEFSILPRNAVLLSSGMEKEEEEETHLQEALSALQVALRSENEAAKSKVSLIPIPESNISVQHYEDIYTAGYKCTKHYLHYRENLLEESCAEYDADSEDEAWLQTNFACATATDTKQDSSSGGHLSSTTGSCAINGGATALLSRATFETMMEKLERNSGQHVTTVAEAKALLQENDDIVMHVYDYWLAKRLRWRQTLMPCVKVDRKDLVGDPYVAFRKRMDRVQTRKNRKNDEISFEKMLRLRKDFHRALEVIEMMKERENVKKQMLVNEMDILALRKENKDFDNVLYNEVMQFVRSEMESRRAMKKVKSFSIMGTPSSTANSVTPPNGLKTAEPEPEENLTSALRRKRKKLRKEKLENMKLKDKASLVSKSAIQSQADSATATAKKTSGDAELSTALVEQNKTGDRQFAFRRVPNLSYHAPLNAVNYQKLQCWPNVHLHYSLTNISTKSVNADQEENNPWEYSTSKNDDVMAGLGAGHVRRYLDTNRNIGYCRRRVGRGGRIVFDRIRTPPTYPVDTNVKNNDVTAAEGNHVSSRGGAPNPEDEREETGFAAATTTVAFLDNCFSSLTSENLPNYLWSHYLDHSYSLFSAEYPQDIPVYLPKAKRHQSLPPSCNLDETGTAASMKTVGGGDSCGRYAMVNDESAAVKESVGCKASSANVVNMQSKLVSSATAFSGHVHNSVIPPQQSNPPHTYVNGATTVIKPAVPTGMGSFGGVDRNGGDSNLLPTSKTANASAAATASTASDVAVVSNQNISTNTSSPLLLAAANFTNTTTLKQQSHTNNHLWRQSMTSSTAFPNTQQQTTLAATSMAATIAPTSATADSDITGFIARKQCTVDGGMATGNGAIGVVSNEQSLALRDRRQQPQTFSSASRMSSAKMTANAAVTGSVGVGNNGAISGNDRANCVLDKSNGGTSVTGVTASRVPLYTHSSVGTQGPQRANTAALLLNNFVSSSDDVSLLGGGGGVVSPGGDQSTGGTYSLNSATPPPGTAPSSFDTYLKIGSPNINNNNKPIAIGLPSRRASSTLGMAAPGQGKEIMGSGGSPGGANTIYDDSTANSPATMKDGAATGATTTAAILFQGGNKTAANKNTASPVDAIDAASVATLSQQKKTAAAAATQQQHGRQAHKRRLLSTAVVNSPSPSNQNNAANQMMSTQMSTTNTLY